MFAPEDGGLLAGFIYSIPAFLVGVVEVVILSLSYQELCENVTDEVTPLP